MQLLPNLVRVRDFQSCHINSSSCGRLAHLSWSLAASATLGVLLVCCKIEADEEEQIAAQDSHPGERGELLACTFAHVRHVGEVGAREVCVGCKIDKEQVDDKLHNLEHCDVLLPPDPNASASLEIVPIHHDVYQEIQCDGNPRDGGAPNELREAKKRCRSVVIGMQEGQGFFLQDHKDRIKKLKILGQIVELV